ncbi:nitrous oxide reductase family maturation protein NosD [Pseudoflavitalea sp. X16]|uniref:nitrous oxide reductase family maturation protein NosD n=1 Tax=Paraflavitalea devenefica TaxID=2716334 RepID=UPI001423E4B4|nr:nitrous oxide reductase family maturation protein NosD [Paraflavitalea devenefica]NII27815.1 nitrous oxide reductase family maturation protein NosD [Paraflavitalea devenefica]
MRPVLSILALLLYQTTFSHLIVAGYGQPIGTLKKAVGLARDGDSILLKQGVYKEGNILLTRPVTLIGEANTILDGENKVELLTISGHNITVRGITFRDAGYSALNDFAAIKVINSNRILLDNNKVLNAYFAIHVSNTIQCTIRNNQVAGRPRSEQLTGNGIHLWKCQQARIENNQVQGHRDGIYFEFVTESVISNNRSERNIRYGLHFMFSHSDRYTGNTFKNNGAGVAVMYSKKVIMEDNHFEENWGPSAFGILLKEITDSHISRNTFKKNTVGIFMEGSSRMEVKKNVFSSNGWAVKVQASCDDNTFQHNNFFGNSFDIATNGTLVLNTFNNNYWDKYDGYDLNKDDLGDVPYHPVSMYAMIVEQNPTTLILMRSFLVSLLDKAEKAIPSLTPENLVDYQPMIKPNKL